MAEGGGFSNAFQFWWPNALLFDFHPSSPTALYHMQASLVITINQMDELKFSHYNAIYYYFFSALCRLPSSRGLHKVQENNSVAINKGLLFDTDYLQVLADYYRRKCI